jgi:two-component system, OmpR family, KDP operon response regulator KdpE
VRKKVLVIEDDPVQARLLTVRLKAAGYNVAVACDGVQSVSAVRRERPDAILLDIGLPGGDGHVVLRRLKAIVHLSAIPIIAVSGRAAETDGERMLSAGADDYFQKPVDLDRLIGRLRELIGDVPLAAAS